MEKCIFCSWSRRTAYPSIRFFQVPREPGLKRVQWLYAIGKREIGPRDRVCSVHFRRGKPSSDPSHEDFAPHLYLNKEPPQEVIEYLEKLADQPAPSYKPKDVPSIAPVDEPLYKARVSTNNPGMMEFNKVTRPAILRRKLPSKETDSSSSSNMKKDILDENEYDSGPVTRPHHSKITPNIRVPPINYSLCDLHLGDGTVKKMRLHKLQQQWIEALSINSGATVVIKVRKRKAPEKTSDAQDQHKVKVQIEDELGNVIEERYVEADQAENIHAQAMSLSRELGPDEKGDGAVIMDGEVVEEGTFVDDGLVYEEVEDMEDMQIVDEHGQIVESERELPLEAESGRSQEYAEIGRDGNPVPEQYVEEQVEAGHTNETQNTGTTVSTTQ